MEAELYCVAWELHNAGFSVVPSGGGEKHKSPLVDWKEYQHRQPSDTELHTWQDQLRPQLWGIVTGDVVVFDTDQAVTAALFEAAGLTPHVRTPRKGGHYYFRSPGHHVKTVAGILPGLDVRGDGGFVNVAGHNHAGEYQILKMPSPDNLYDWSQVPPAVLEALNAPQKAVSKGETPAIPEGQRNATLTSFAGSMRRRGMTEDAIAAALLETNAGQCAPPLPEDEVRGIAASVARYPPDNGNVTISNNVTTGGGVGYIERDTSDSRTNRDKNVTDSVTPGVTPFEGLSDRVLAWVKATSGWWAADELDRDLGISGKDKENRRQILHRFKEQGIVEQHPKVNKHWRYVNKAVTRIDFKSASSARALAVRWPMGIEKKVNLFPGNLAVVAGAQEAGKTALLLNFIKMNMERFPIYYLCSENMGGAELRMRLELFTDVRPEE